MNTSVKTIAAFVAGTIGGIALGMLLISPADKVSSDKKNWSSLRHGLFGGDKNEELRKLIKDQIREEEGEFEQA